jgi:hypothetical protein
MTYTPATKRQETRREDMGKLPPRDQCIGNEAHQGNDSRVEPSETNLCQLERAGQAIQCSHQGLDELLRPLLQVRTVPALQLYRCEAGAVGAAQVPQISGKADAGASLAKTVVNQAPGLSVRWPARGRVTVRTMGAV